MKTCMLLLAFLGLSAGLVFAQADCHAFFPIRDGIRMEYDTYDKKEKLNGRVAQRFKNIRELESGVMATFFQEVIDLKKNEAISRAESEWSCSNGTILFNMNSLFLATDEERITLAEGMSIDVTGDPMDIPSRFEVGESLKDIQYNVKMLVDQLAVMEKKFKIKDRKVAGIEHVTTPAGTFECYKLTSTTESRGRLGASTVKSVVWYSKSVGMVKAENYKENGRLINRMELAKIEQ